jgi:hypothetical protein
LDGGSLIIKIRIRIILFSKEVLLVVTKSNTKTTNTNKLQLSGWVKHLLSGKKRAKEKLGEGM